MSAPCKEHPLPWRFYRGDDNKGYDDSKIFSANGGEVASTEAGGGWDGGFCEDCAAFMVKAVNATRVP